MLIHASPSEEGDLDGLILIAKAFGVIAIILFALVCVAKAHDMDDEEDSVP